SRQRLQFRDPAAAGSESCRCRATRKPSQGGKKCCADRARRVHSSRERKSMNGPHKFGTEFGSDNAPEHSAAIVSHHDSIKWFEAIPGEQLCIRVHGTQV